MLVVLRRGSVALCVATLVACAGAAEPPVALSCPARPTVAQPSTWVPPEKRGPKLVRINGGEFTMGAEDEVFSPEASPPHRVKVETFYMDETEVSAGQYAACVSAGVCVAQVSVLPNRVPLAKGDIAAMRLENDSCNLMAHGREDHPMNCVDWYQAGRFCAWAYKRLPTAEEWEFAARGQEGRKFPWSSQDPTPERANIGGEECVPEMARYDTWNFGHRSGWNDGFPHTAPVHSLPAGRTPDGLWGMAGNVTELTSTMFCSYSRDWCLGQLVENRGSSWVAGEVLPAANRFGVPRSLRRGFVGFRCASRTSSPEASHAVGTP